jgi:predicted phosphodiesterase
MRLAVLADIHGNADALMAVLDDLNRHSPDLTVNLGDCLSGPLEPARTADILMAQDWPTVRGNHDRWLVSPPDPIGPWEASALPALTPAHLAWLAALPPRLSVGGALLCHATPQDDLTYWLHHVLPDGSFVPAPRHRIAPHAEGIAESLILCAHTHIARAVQLPGGPLIVNPGSVGCPGYDDDHPVPHLVEQGTPLACYALLDQRPGGWALSFRQIPYDNTRAAALAAAGGSTAWQEALSSGWLL